MFTYHTLLRRVELEKYNMKFKKLRKVCLSKRNLYYVMNLLPTNQIGLGYNHINIINKEKF